ncbi:S1 family peptidase [Denitromonas ohlonensis]|uniref:Trypsin-like peptidase domain-containing protein n=2 Tax=Denitromonas TaxID=139331 RepID=A0A557S4U5_9RHOO|nr:serine protease [Denitromonas ohlonensis]TVT47718.1 MAG: trypsin-like peptidase domain-containing protein [Denitromonas halophila]TVO62513.1 trypsin-like peptidase domain-containing protein [Denitromonas ohlonensis]TVO72367.1 trypsin-like peptidase domain-containing protein [Denitromonas ohlonensis]TVT68427.1 MAG: trypsin-like peptidase domain-containing protein [Denitromonas halophila]TVT77786.1 MAG: trypsin-like peptidase domain-containing protein [Denitromonas halophila]
MSRWLCFAVSALMMLVSVSVRADLPATVSRVKPSIVAVGTYEPTRSPAFRFLGTGFVVGDGLTVATNAHVLPASVDANRRETLAVAIPLGDKVNVRSAEKLRSDPAHDLATLRIVGPALPVLVLSSGEAEEGQSVAFTGFPIGSALGLKPATHRGIVSAITPISIPRGNARELNARQIRSLGNDPFSVYQLDATAYPGNSGSPLFDPVSGAVLGVLNMVFVKDTKENVLSKPSGISYAIPVRYLNDLLY